MRETAVFPICGSDKCKCCQQGRRVSRNKYQAGYNAGFANGRKALTAESWIWTTLIERTAREMAKPIEGMLDALPRKIQHAARIVEWSAERIALVEIALAEIVAAVESGGAALDATTRERLEYRLKQAGVKSQLRDEEQIDEKLSDADVREILLREAEKRAGA